MTDSDATQDLVDRVREAHSRCVPLRIVGGNTKPFYGRQTGGDRLSTQAHRGIVSYDPSELVITVRSGTLLAEVETALAEHEQCLPFEPPAFGPLATVGGVVACGLAGPARASAGTVRDHLLGVRLLTGDGRVLRFGGEVIKNVAGYDVSRLLAGSLGILGVLLEVSLKVLPRRPATATRVLEVDQRTAIERLPDWAASPLPLTASSWVDGRLYLRFDGSPGTLAAVENRVGGEPLEDATSFWAGLREQTHPFFAACSRLIRVHVPANSPPLDLPDPPLIEWHGVERWYCDASQAELTAEVRAHGGRATVFRGAEPAEEIFEPLAPTVWRLHQALKQVFDPGAILNPGRMYAGL